MWVFVAYLEWLKLYCKQDKKASTQKTTLTEGNNLMARRNHDDDLLLEEDELTAAFLGDDEAVSAEQGEEEPQVQMGNPAEDQWDEDEAVPGQLAVDVYETKEKLVVKARTAGVNKNELDVSISDNQLTIRGTLSAGTEDDVENYFLQECYWGEFSRTIALPVPVKEEDIEAVLKDGVLTISFGKVKQDTVKKIQVL
jgi:HSP20 family protein